MKSNDPKKERWRKAASQAMIGTLCPKCGGKGVADYTRDNKIYEAPIRKRRRKCECSNTYHTVEINVDDYLKLLEDSGLVVCARGYRPPTQ